MFPWVKGRYEEIQRKQNPGADKEGPAYQRVAHRIMGKTQT
jgi:hypothetical protein